MIRAGSLIYAIGIALILAIISSSLILLAFNSRTAADISLINEKLITNVNSGLNYYLTTYEQWDGNSKLSVDLFQRNNDSVDIERKPWGLFEVIICKAHQGNKNAQGIFLAGDESNKDSVALYLADQNKPLAVCGKTLIKGNAFIPAQGIKRAYIEGQNFIGTRLVEGTTYNSTLSLPGIGQNIEANLLAAKAGNNDSVLSINALQENKRLYNSFNNRTIVLNSTGDIDLDNYNLEGNIIIRTDRKVQIRASSVLAEVLIYAGSVVVDEGFSGRFQAFGRDSIIINEKVTLNYPSTLCIVKAQNQTTKPKIILHSGSNVKGNVINFNAADIQSKSINLEIAENCNITGLVYSNGYISHKGMVTGSLYCGGFILRTPSAIYENHLLNAVINSMDLPESYIGVFPLASVKRKAMIKRVE